MKLFWRYYNPSFLAAVYIFNKLADRRKVIKLYLVTVNRKCTDSKTKKKGIISNKFEVAYYQLNTEVV